MAEPRAEEPGELVLVLTTAPSADAAGRLARQLVEDRLIACGNLIPGLSSVYRWGGEVVNEDEVLILMKTPPALVARLFARVAELHPYEVPEIVSLRVDTVSAAYLQWVRQETIEVNA